MGQINRLCTQCLCNPAHRYIDRQSSCWVFSSIFFRFFSLPILDVCAVSALTKVENKAHTLTQAIAVTLHKQIITSRKQQQIFSFCNQYTARDLLFEPRIDFIIEFFRILQLLGLSFDRKKKQFHIADMGFHREFSNL